MNVGNNIIKRGMIQRCKGRAYLLWHKLAQIVSESDHTFGSSYQFIGKTRDRETYYKRLNLQSPNCAKLFRTNDPVSSTNKLPKSKNNNNTKKKKKHNRK